MPWTSAGVCGAAACAPAPVGSRDRVRTRRWARAHHNKKLTVRHKPHQERVQALLLLRGLVLLLPRVGHRGARSEQRMRGCISVKPPSCRASSPPMVRVGPSSCRHRRCRPTQQSSSCGRTPACAAGAAAEASGAELHGAGRRLCTSGRYARHRQLAPTDAPVLLLKQSSTRGGLQSVQTCVWCSGLQRVPGAPGAPLMGTCVPHARRKCSLTQTLSSTCVATLLLSSPSLLSLFSRSQGGGGPRPRIASSEPSARSLRRGESPRCSAARRARFLL